VPLQLEGPREDAFGVLASALLPAFFLRRNADGQVVRAFAERAPATLAVAERLLEAGAPEHAARGVALPEALEAIWMYLERAEPL
jgi:Flp pilus assembly protein TadB